MLDTKLLKSEERAVISLRELYRRYGYLPFKMSKFEEYELYIRNKDFLVSDRIITFNDTNGKLMALKPDVTLSIIKNGEDLPNCKQKVYYNENVYRVSESTRQFKEIMQTGLECIGDIDLYDIFETVSLAAQSLAMIQQNFILEISHLGILSAILEDIGADESFSLEAIHCIAEKNAHDLSGLCSRHEIDPLQAERLAAFIQLYGDRHRVLKGLEKICVGTKAAPAFDLLRQLSALLDSTPFGEQIIFDFSVVNNMNYYNGIVFKGFLDGICSGVLAGGQYDKLMHKMGRKSGAVGFALYLDLLEQLQVVQTDYDVTVLLLYDETTKKQAVAAAVQQLIDQGKTVSAQKAVPQKLRYQELIDLRKGAAPC